MKHQITSIEEYHEVYQKSVEQPEAFWADIAESFEWKKKWDKVLEWDFITPDVKWFKGGKLNITENCLDRHLAELGDQKAIIWEANEVGEATRTLTYKELHVEVCKLANVLKSNGAKKGDRICLYMPMVPELAIAVLACARIGAIHSVVFAGFSANSLADRINDASCNLLLTADGSFRGDKTIGLKDIADEALKTCPSIEKVIVLQRTKQSTQWEEGRDVWYHDAMATASPICKAEEMDAEDMLFILYTSGSTGKPKGVVHTCGGYMVYIYYTFINVFQYQPNDIYWCTADIGWVTGHSYIVYGPLLAGATTVMFEGVPTYPDAGRFWEVCDKLQVNQFYTAPTAIRALMAKGDEYVEPYRLDSLKVIGSVGEPINVEAWQWYYKTIGKEKCYLVDTWWQTETGGILISGIPNATKMKPTFASLPLPGVQPCLVDKDGNELDENGIEGLLCVKFPWPSIIRTTYGDHERCRNVYFSAFKDKYFTGDGCRRDNDGFYRIIGRVDDVINVSGHRLGTAEVENALDEHDNIVEAAVVGYPHDIKGQGIYAYVIVQDAVEDEDAFRKEVRDIVTEVIGAIAKPDKIQIVSGLPKTRSGKIMRRILRKIASGDMSNMGDTSTLLDPAVVEEIKAGRL
ncbi:MAG: acetate--CoA ligase [Chitinophagales bacterium]